LNAGFRIPPSAGSANGVLRSPLGYNRSYVNLGRRFSYEGWLAGQKEGRNFVTNGPLLFLTVRGASVRLRALSGAELDKAEIVVDGEVVKTFAATPGSSSLTGEARVRVEEGGWLAARVFEKNDKTVRFAHSAPVYFGKKARRSPQALARMREWIDALVEHVEPLRDLTPAQREEWLTLCRQAREFYQ